MISPTQWVAADFCLVQIAYAPILPSLPLPGQAYCLGLLLPSLGAVPSLLSNLTSPGLHGKEGKGWAWVYCIQSTVCGH